MNFDYLILGQETIHSKRWMRIVGIIFYYLLLISHSNPYMRVCHTFLGPMHLTYYCKLDAKYERLRGFQRWCWQQRRGCSRERRIWTSKGRECGFYNILVETSWRHIEIIICPLNPKYVSIVQFFLQIFLDGEDQMSSCM